VNTFYISVQNHLSCPHLSKNVVLMRTLEVKEGKLQENGEHYMKRNFIICTLRKYY
jgi:hypothetical protein